ncbi:MAG: hypothetical protein KDA96_25030 [Planctomycetaceae bacterium]|nr:hypothetical protein [Planctomycetaceae bacterium]
MSGDPFGGQNQQYNNPFQSGNPYQNGAAGPQAGFSGGPPVNQRPTSMTVFGILNIVFSVMGICGATIGIISMFMMQQGQQFGPPNPAIDIMLNSPAYRVFNIISQIVGLLTAFILLTSGIGLLKGRSFGRTLANVYAVIAIVGGIAGTIASYFILVVPMMQQANQGPEQQAAAIGGAIGGLVGGCVGMIYPILVLVFMNRATVKEYLQRQEAQSLAM